MLSSIPESKGEHSAEFLQALFTPCAVRFQHDFGIGVADECTSATFEFLAHIAEVVNLTVVDDPVSSVGIVHRLVSERRQIKNGQASVPQAHFNPAFLILERDSAGVVGAAMGKRLGASFDEALLDPGVPRDNSENSAHLE